MKSRSHLVMEATFKRAEWCERWISCRCGDRGHRGSFQTESGSVSNQRPPEFTAGAGKPPDSVAEARAFEGTLASIACAAGAEAPDIRHFEARTTSAPSRLLISYQQLRPTTSSNVTGCATIVTAMGQIRPWRSIHVDGGLSLDSFRAGPIRNAPPWLALPFGVPDDQPSHPAARELNES